MSVADHVQKVMKPNFAASWDELGEANELEDTYALSTMKTLEGACTHRSADSADNFCIIFRRSLYCA